MESRAASKVPSNHFSVTSLKMEISKKLRLWKSKIIAEKNMKKIILVPNFRPPHECCLILISFCFQSNKATDGATLKTD